MVVGQIQVSTVLLANKQCKKPLQINSTKTVQNAYMITMEGIARRIRGVSFENCATRCSWWQIFVDKKDVYRLPYDTMTLELDDFEMSNWGST